MISIIAAIGENRVIGKDNKLIWSIPEDMKFFRDTTKDNVVIMGRKTFESIGKPLPNRINIVLTQNKDFYHQGIIVCNTVEESIQKAKYFTNKKVFVIGGEQIYKQFLNFSERLYLTVIKGNFSGDSFFPDYSDFNRIISKRESKSNGYEYEFLVLEK